MKDVVVTLKERLSVLKQTLVELQNTISQLPLLKSEIKRGEKALALLDVEEGKTRRKSIKRRARKVVRRRGRKPGPKKGTKYGKRKAKKTRKSKGPKLSKNGKRMGRPPKVATAAPVVPPKAA